MPAKLRWKWIVIVFVVLVSVAGIVGLPTSLEALAANLKKNIQLGLDLRGGSQIVMQVQIQDAFKVEADSAIERLKTGLTDRRIIYTSIERNGPASVETADDIRITAKGVWSAQAAESRRVAMDVLGANWAFVGEDNAGQQFGLSPEAARRLRQETVTQTMNTLERRINLWGIAETSIQRRGGSDSAEILIHLPGVDDPARLKSTLITTAFLEFTSVMDGPFPSTSAAFAAHQGALPSNTKLVPEQSRSAGDPEVWWLVSQSPVVTGRDLRDARMQQGHFTGAWETAFVLTPSAAERFARFTEANIGKRLAIVLDNVVLSAAEVESRIHDQGRIMGAFSRQEAADLALNLRAGSLPAGVKLTEQTTVGPSLGADSIRSGLTAGAAGFLLVVSSMIVYYRGTGLNAVLALLLNAVMTVSVLSYFGAAWTLPGIAGLVLSIGMAVDSNVLIFERIKEELRAGKRIASAIASGFDRALVTIIDTHVTTVVASAFLFMFGTTLVRGFAVTLVVGLLANIFTAIYISRGLFDLKLWRNPGLQRLSIGAEGNDQRGGSALDFMKRNKVTLAISVAMVLFSIAGIAGYGLKPGLDFRGGALMSVRFTESQAIEELRRAVSSKLQSEVTVQTSRGTTDFIVGVALAGEDNLAQTRENVESALRDKYGADKFEIRSAHVVEPRAGQEMRKQALFATLSAAGGMLVYVAFRFQWISGIAAVIATIHDVVITLGIFAWTDREITLNIVAALLTLIGYSMNDKIVVFDRVRENQRHGGRGVPFRLLVNQSINQTLSRTVLTAGPTLLACLALYFLGGEVLNGIAFALFTGIVAGTYSSIFVASSLLVLWSKADSRAPS